MHDISWCYQKHTEGLHNAKILCFPSEKRKQDGEVHRLSHPFYSVIAAARKPYTAHVVDGTWDAAHICGKCGGMFRDKRLWGEGKRERRRKRDGKGEPGTERRVRIRDI